jgi:hypothetical protein
MLPYQQLLVDCKQVSPLISLTLTDKSSKKENLNNELLKYYGEKIENGKSSAGGAFDPIENQSHIS